MIDAFFEALSEQIQEVFDRVTLAAYFGSNDLSNLFFLNEFNSNFYIKSYILQENMLFNPILMCLRVLTYFIAFV